MIYRFNFRDVWANFDLLLEGALLTLQLSAATMVLGLAIGIAGAMSRGSAVGPVRWAARGYVEAIRNTPLLIQIFIIYFGLPGIGLKFDVGTAAFIALTDKLDIVISVMGLTPERAKQIMFTGPYASLFLGVYGAKNANVKSAADLGSLKVSAPRGTTQELALTALAPRANIMRTEDDATSAAAYLSGQADLFATTNVVAVDLAARNPNKEFDLKFVIRTSPAHMGVRMGEHNLARWLDSFIFASKLNGELEKLHQKWLGGSMQPMPTL